MKRRGETTGILRGGQGRVELVRVGGGRSWVTAVRRRLVREGRSLTVLLLRVELLRMRVRLRMGRERGATVRIHLCSGDVDLVRLERSDGELVWACLSVRMSELTTRSSLSHFDVSFHENSQAL